MSSTDSQRPVVLCVAAQEQQFQQLVRCAQTHDGGRLYSEFSFEYIDSFPGLTDWYRRHHGRFVSLLVIDVDFTAVKDDSRLLSFADAGLRPAGEPYDTRACQGFIIYHRIRQTGLDCLAPVLFVAGPTMLREGHQFAHFIVYQGYGSCSFVVNSGFEAEADEVMRSIDSNALRPLSDERRRYWREHHRMAVGRSRAMAHLVHEIERVGPTEGTVLLLGNAGVGKELAAQALHRCSSRYVQSDPQRHLPLTVSMVALERNLVLDELFGHLEGAYTGATSDRAGIFETGQGSSVFLDEIGDIDVELQQKLLRVIEYRRVRRLGSSVETAVDIRIIAATNRPLPALQAQFRWDFYTRMVQQCIHVPALRERWADATSGVVEADVAELMEFVISELNRNPRYHYKLAPDHTAIKLLARLVEQHVSGENSIFDGEMRSLRNVIERSYERAQYDGVPVVGLSQVASTVTRFQALSRHQPGPHPSPSLEDVTGTLNLKSIERVAIADALRKTSGNRVKAAELLGLHRNTLAAKIKEYGL